MGGYSFVVKDFCGYAKIRLIFGDYSANVKKGDIPTFLVNKNHEKYCELLESELRRKYYVR